MVVSVLAVKAIRLAGRVAQHSLRWWRTSGMRCWVVRSEPGIYDVIVARRLLVLLRLIATAAARVVVRHVDRDRSREENE